MTRERLPNFARTVSKLVRLPPVLDTIVKVEDYALELCLKLKTAINATGTRPRANGGKSAPWWTPACKEARAEYRAAELPIQRAVYAKKLRSVIRAAKKEHQAQQVEKMNTQSDVYKLMRMAGPRQINIISPLNHNGVLISDLL